MYHSLIERITIDPEQCGGRPCIRGMRRSGWLRLLPSRVRVAKRARGMAILEKCNRIDSEACTSMKICAYAMI